MSQEPLSKFEIERLNDLDKKRDAQLKMTWLTLFGMIVYPLLIILCVYMGALEAAKLLTEIAPTYFGSGAVILAAFFSTEAWKSK